MDKQRIGMIGEHEEIQRPFQPGRLTMGRHNGLAFGKAICLIWAKCRAKCIGIHGQI